MQINDPDALKYWLTTILEPLCEADPAALARYVLALLKKDKPVKELSQCMQDQLDVFLGPDTEPFLHRLFEAIKSEDYIKPNLAITPKTSLVSSNVTLDSEIKESNVNIDTSNIRENTPELLNDNKNMRDDSEVIVAEASPMLSPISKSSEVTPNSEKTAVEKEILAKDNGRRRIGTRSRSRSRSRSFERHIRSRDNRVIEREKSNRQYRNKSPPLTDRRRYERRIDRSPKPYNRASRTRTQSRSRSKSPDRRKKLGSMSPLGESAVNNKRQRCRDFDEKGYCMRGETCPWDHGIDPVVLEDINNPALLMQSGPVRGGEYNPDAPEIWNRGNNFGPRGGHGIRNGPPSSYPRPPGVAAFQRGPQFPFPLNPGVTTPLQRELISVPVVDANSGGDASAQGKRRYEPEDTVAVAEGPAKRKLPINNRLGLRLGIQQNCSLELRKVPRGLNSIAHLNNHFSKFGKIVNIQITYDGDPEAAIITFSTHAEANVAYRSTEAVLNNRFIKVFWHALGASNDAIPQTCKEENVTHSRKTNQYSLNNIVPAVPIPAATDALANKAAGSSTTNLPTTISIGNSASTTVPVSPSPPTAALRARNNRVNRAATEMIRKKQEEQVKVAVQIAHGLHKRKHVLLQEYIKQMRSAVELVERTENTDTQRSKLLVTIKELQTTIDNLNKEIASDQASIAAQIQPQSVVRKTKEQQKKELLDIELELIAQQQEGNDTTAIQKRIEELQRNLGKATQKQHYSIGRSRPAPPGSTSVDRRPTTILINGFSPDECDDVLGHFKHFGEVTKSQMDKVMPSLTITFATRVHAEQAILRGRSFKSKQLQISWSSTVAPVKRSDDNSGIVRQLGPIQKHESSLEYNNVTRREDEEEEEDAESEDRSWRR